MVDRNIWTRNYAPKSLEDMILHPVVRNQLENVLNNPQSIILYGSPGVGKGTFTKIFLENFGCDKMWKNASHDTGIDMIRKDILPFATAASVKTFFNNYTPGDQEYQKQFKYLKVVVLNEAENLSTEAQNALREIMENNETRCKFFFMTNKLEKIDDAIRSRCHLIEIKDPHLPDILHFMEKILNEEGITYDGSILSSFVNEHYPDIRKTINEIKGHCKGNTLEKGDFNKVSVRIDKCFIDLRMYIAYYGLKRKDVYDKIKDEIEFSVTRKVFYMLLDPKLQHKVGLRKKEAVVDCIKVFYPLKKWLYDYTSLE